MQAAAPPTVAVLSSASMWEYPGNSSCSRLRLPEPKQNWSVHREPLLDALLRAFSLCGLPTMLCVKPHLGLD